MDAPIAAFTIKRLCLFSNRFVTNMARTGREAGYYWARIDLDVAPKDESPGRYGGNWGTVPREDVAQSVCLSLVR